MALNNYWLKNGLITVFQNFGSLFLGFANFYMLIRILSTDEYGTLVIFTSITTVIELSKNGLTQEATIKYLSGADSLNRGKITTAAFIINFLVALILMFAFWILTPYAGKIWHSDTLPKMLNLYTIILFISGILSQLNCIEQSNLRFSGFSTSTIIRQFIPFLYISFCFLWNVKIALIQLVVIYILSIIVATFVSFLFTYRFITFSRLVDFGWIKKILNFGKYSFGIWLNTMLSSSIDQMMLGSMLSKSASGSFNVAVRVTNLTDIPANSIASIVFPQSSKRFEEEGDSSIKYMYEKSVGVILAILIPMLILIYLSLDYILIFIAGEKYQGVLPLLQIVLAGTIISPFGRQTGIVLAASGRAKVNFYLMLASTILVILFNLLLIKPYGVFGAAIASIAAGFVLFIISQFLLKKYYKVSIKNVFIYAVSFYREFYNNYILKRK